MIYSDNFIKVLDMLSSFMTIFPSGFCMILTFGNQKLVFDVTVYTD